MIRLGVTHPSASDRGCGMIKINKSKSKIKLNYESIKYKQLEKLREREWVGWKFGHRLCIYIFFFQQKNE